MHAQKILHRSLSPDNLLLTHEGLIKIVGFSRASMLEEQLTTDSAQDPFDLSWLNHAAPELTFAQEKASYPADIYGLGSTLCFLLTGEHPDPRASAAEYLWQRHSGPVPELASRRPTLPPRLMSIFQRMVANDPKDRFQSAEELHQELQNFLADFGEAGPVR